MGSRDGLECSEFDIVDALARDAAGEGLRDLSHYLQRFSGYESMVAEEYHRLKCPGDPADGTTESSENHSNDHVAIQSRLRTLSEPLRRGGRYQKEKEIARGGMGVVFRVHDLELERTLALKEMHVEQSPSDSLGVARFLEEAQVTAQLDHPGIVPVHEVGINESGRLFFAMKLVRGRDLKTILGLLERKEDGWNLPRLLTVLLRVCEAMSFAHSKGVIHRDLKPSNVMVGSFGEVYVMDWGLARTLGRPDLHDMRIRRGSLSTSLRTVLRHEREGDGSSPLLTMDGDVVGTPAYMSPEQARGERESILPCSDVYSIGAILYHALTGQAPFVPAGAKLQAQNVLWRVLEGPPTPALKIRSDIPPELIAIQERAMAREQHHRYRDTGELGADLRAYLEQRVVLAYQRGLLADLQKWIARNRMFSGAVVASFLLLAGGITVSWIYKLRADVNASLAQENARSAQESMLRADRETEAATKRADEVLQLSALQEVEDLLLEADRLWPAYPELLPRFEGWLVRARELLSRLPDDEDRIARLKEAAALPGDEVREAYITSHPRHAELVQAQHELGFLEKMLESLESGEPPAEASLEEESTITLPTSAKALNVIAWNLVDPDRDDYGHEARGLALARRAVGLASDLAFDEQAEVHDTLAWALFANARFDEAIAEEEVALAKAPESRKKDYTSYLERLTRQIQDAIDPDSDSVRTRRIRDLRDRIAQIETDMSRDEGLVFESDSDRWWYDQLQKLVGGLRELDGLTGRGISPKHGWGIERRMSFARSIGPNSLEGAAARKWREAVASIADPVECPLYDGLEIVPQVGLVPLGRNPESGLWEFVHLQSGPLPEEGTALEAMSLVETGIVLVLVPGGPFIMGAQASDPDAENYDIQAGEIESPTHLVWLSPFFIAKYEMTQRQWVEFVGRNPSQHQESLAHPVERVSWTDCTQALLRMGLQLPTEAQWEYAARAGTRSVWWCGDQRSALSLAGNIADAFAKAHGTEAWGNHELDVNDGNTIHARIGSFAANAFGLHDVVGNVREWCQDAYRAAYYLESRRQDPVYDPTNAPVRIARGGGFDGSAAYARSASREYATPETALDTLGLRPARALVRP